jgi:predicted glycoside hydrolase/deacetylase ChbG (UPF0249 family)
MGPNPLLKKLGFSNDDRVVIIHTDDIGMCQASVAAFADLWEFGVISSGAVMVPCPWFLEAAKFARGNPDVDLGVHITLTSEWDVYRWGPVSTRDLNSGMIDSEGCFYRTSSEVQEHGDPDSVRVEIQAQIQRALDNGIQATHVDTHMGTVGSMKFMPSYLQLSIQNGLPPMMMRLDKEGWLEMGIEDELADLAVQMVAQLEQDGVPLLDRIAALELDRAKSREERIAYAKRVFDELKPGITHFIIHPSVDTPELRAITPDWHCRVADFEAFRSDEMRNILKESGIQVIGYRTIKELMSP